MRALRNIPIVVVALLLTPHAHAQFLKKPITRPAGIPYIDAPNISDVAMTLLTPQGHIVCVNYNILNNRLWWPLSEFFLIHEEGHAYFQHTWKQPDFSNDDEDNHESIRAIDCSNVHQYEGKVPESSEEIARRHQMELEADCYAAYVLSDSLPGAVHAAIVFFQMKAPHLPTHPHPYLRAGRIADCLTEANAQIPKSP